MHSNHPMDLGVEGNKIAGPYAKWAAEGYTDPVDEEHLREASLAHLTREITEAMVGDA